ncbi:MAG: TIGR04086 family membrane protein [Syntrophomonadaceae bacterium]|jgi:putative membrane protein (TIGR04086 family)
MWKNISIELNGLARAILISLLLAVAAATVVYFTRLSEESFGLLAKIILAGGVFTGAAYVAKARATRGLVRGLNFGVMIFILMLIATLATNPGLIGIKSSLYNLLLCMVSGALGGVLGIGLSNNI